MESAHLTGGAESRVVEIRMSEAEARELFHSLRPTLKTPAAYDDLHAELRRAVAKLEYGDRTSD